MVSVATSNKNNREGFTHLCSEYIVGHGTICCPQKYLANAPDVTTDKIYYM